MYFIHLARFPPPCRRCPRRRSPWASRAGITVPSPVWRFRNCWRTTETSWLEKARANKNTCCLCTGAASAGTSSFRVQTWVCLISAFSFQYVVFAVLIGHLFDEGHDVYLGCVSSWRWGLRHCSAAHESPPQLPTKRHKEDRHCAEETHPQGSSLIPNQSHDYYADYCWVEINMVPRLLIGLIFVVFNGISSTLAK